jgi:dienelactone hydrolase
VTKTVNYSQGGQALQGYLAYDDSFKGKRPGILVAHQWKGLGEYEKRRSRMLAQMGYVAFRPRYLRQGRASQRSQGSGGTGWKISLQSSLLRERARAAVIALKKQPNVDAKKLAIIGYCFGAEQLLNWRAAS